MGRWTHRGASGAKPLNAVETEAFEDAADGCRRDADFGRDMLAGETLAAKGLDVGAHRGRRRLATGKLGFQDRPSVPPLRSNGSTSRHPVILRMMCVDCSL
jgi:hypothetical protein